MTLPIKYAHYLLNGVKKKFLPITSDEAVIDDSGQNLKNRLTTLAESLSEPFDPTKTYYINQYCIYQNQVYRFKKKKNPGDFDGTAVVKIKLTNVIKIIDDQFKTIELIDELPMDVGDGGRFVMTGPNTPSGLPAWFFGVYIYYGNDAVIFGTSVANQAIVIKTRNNLVWG